MPAITLFPSHIEGKIQIPGSKSQTIRAALIATFARGVSHITGALESRDTLACFRLCESLGAKLSWSPDRSQLDIDSRGFHATDGMTVDCMNSGTTLCLATGMLASLPVTIRVTGDSQLSARPIKPMLEALKQLGASYEGDHVPFTLHGPASGGKCSVECRTSQYLSGLLLGAAMMEKDAEISVPLLYEKPYVGLTLGWLEKQHIRYSCLPDWSRFTVPAGQQFRSFSSSVTGDWSSAAFFFGMAAMGKTSVTVANLDPQDIQGDRHVLDVLEAMGCKVRWQGQEVTVTGPERLKGGTFDLNSIPDSLPILAAVATQAEGDVRLANVAQARIKETDRIKAMTRELRKLGADIDEEQDGMTVHGGKPLHGDVVDGWGDHRVIMALASLSTVLPGKTVITGENATDVTFPTFFALLDSLRRKS